MSPRKTLIAINAADRITRASLCRLGGCLDAWLEAGAGDAGKLAPTLGVPARQLRRALALRPRAGAIADRELERARRHRCRIVTLLDGEYPAPLREHALPPPVLYCRGRIPARPAVAIVGARRMDAYGAEAAAVFARRLAATGITVVSGFARGIDTTAHEAALAAENGTTVAVLGCGLDVDYPRGSSRLADRIAERGAMVTEFGFGAEPLPWRFPIRNRVIAALALGTLVVQATARSGSLITAHQALELGRDVYAVPGRIFDDLAQGTNALIADGALVARRPEDVLESLPLLQQQVLFPSRKDKIFADRADHRTGSTAVGEPPEGFADKVLQAVPAADGRTSEDIAAEIEVPIDRVLAALLELELQGWIRREPGPVYVR
ncbi:MAG: DNA-processing protein DprA [Thermoanaerobaculia bacterium]